MYEDNKNKLDGEDFASGCLTAVILAGLVWMLLLLLLPGCSPRIVEQVRTEYKTVTDYQRDTLWRDRIKTIREKGDTVFIHDSVTVYKSRDREKHDTLVVRDSIPVPVPVEVTKEVEVEKPLTGWQRFRIGAFWWLLAITLGLGLWTFRKVIF